MLYCQDPTADTPIMHINKHIGFDEQEGQGVDGSLFQEELLMLDSMGKKSIQIWINSPGGVVMDGYNIYSAILNTKTKVDTVNVGIAASIAAVIFQAGRNRIMSDYSLLMYHNPYGGDDSEQLDKMRQSLAIMISQRSQNSEENILKMMDKTTWISASEAFRTGMCDSIEVTSEKNKKRMSGDQPKMLWKEATQIVNSILITKTDKKMSMTKVTNKLGLNEDASQDSILAAILEIENKAESKSEALDKAEAELKHAKEKCDELENKCNELKKQADEDAEAKAKAEMDAKEEKAKNMVNDFAKQGRIKVEAVDSWVKTTLSIGFEEVKAMLQELPIHKKAATFDVENALNEKDAEQIMSNAAAIAMNDIKNKLSK